MTSLADSIRERQLAGINWKSLTEEQLREMITVWKKTVEENQVNAAC